MTDLNKIEEHIDHWEHSGDGFHGRVAMREMVRFLRTLTPRAEEKREAHVCDFFATNVCRMCGRHCADHPAAEKPEPEGAEEKPKLDKCAACENYADPRFSRRHPDSGELVFLCDGCPPSEKDEYDYEDVLAAKIRAKTAERKQPEPEGAGEPSDLTIKLVGRSHGKRVYNQGYEAGRASLAAELANLRDRDKLAVEALQWLAGTHPMCADRQQTAHQLVSKAETCLSTAVGSPEVLANSKAWASDILAAELTELRDYRRRYSLVQGQLRPYLGERVELPEVVVPELLAELAEARSIIGLALGSYYEEEDDWTARAQTFLGRPVQPTCTKLLLRAEAAEDELRKKDERIGELSAKAAAIMMDMAQAGSEDVQAANRRIAELEAKVAAAKEMFESMLEVAADTLDCPCCSMTDGLSDRKFVSHDKRCGLVEVAEKLDAIPAELRPEKP